MYTILVLYGSQRTYTLSHWSIHDYHGNDNIYNMLFISRYQHDAQSFPIDNDERQISFIVNDGVFNSTSAIACVRLVDSNDPPFLTLGTNGTVDVMLMYLEGQVELLYLAPALEITGENREGSKFFLFRVYLNVDIESVM